MAMSLFAYNDVNEGTDLAARGEFAAGPFVFNLSAIITAMPTMYEIPGFRRIVLPARARRS